MDITGDWIELLKRLKCLSDNEIVSPDGRSLSLRFRAGGYYRQGNENGKYRLFIEGPFIRADAFDGRNKQVDYFRLDEVSTVTLD